MAEKKVEKKNKSNEKKSKSERYAVKYSSFYSSKDWRALRDYKRELNPLCEKCYAKGIIKDTEEIHHMVSIEADMSKALELDNLISLCKSCHDSEHERQSPLQEFMKAWEEI